jgi:hypothetical protein
MKVHGKRTGQPRNRIARTGQPGKICQDRILRTGHSGQRQQGEDSQEKTKTVKGLPIQDCWDRPLQSGHQVVKIYKI